MTTSHRSTRARWLWVVVVALVVYVAIWGHRFIVTRFGALAPLVMVLGALPIVIAVVVWAWRRFGGEVARAFDRAVRALFAPVERSRWYQTGRMRHPAVWRIVIDRFDPHLATGLGLSVVIVAAGGALWAFGSVVMRVVVASPLTVVDQRIVNLFQMLRTPGGDRVMLDASYIGSGRAVGTLAAAAAITALILRRRRDAMLVVASLVAGAAFFSVVKLIVRRPRPPLHSARIVQSGFSFPSGHATMAAVFYATIAMILVAALRSDWLRALVIIVASALIVWIGLSRIYLGVHYPSDVLAGWSAGLLWALLVLAAERIWTAERARRSAVGAEAGDAAASAGAWAHEPIGPVRGAAAAVVPAAAIAFLAVTRPAIPAPPHPARVVHDAVAPPQLVTAIRTRAPLYTVGPFGHRQEPINLVFVGSADELRRTFRAVGWVEAERLSVSSLRHAAVATMTGGGDPTGPVTPSFLGVAPEALAFSQPVGRTFARRHHIRIWTAPFDCSDSVGGSGPVARPVWLATASFDQGYAIATGSLLPVHQIAPDIDAERDYIARSLGATGLLADTARTQLVPPEKGTNAFGEPFYTHGQVFVAHLR